MPPCQVRRVFDPHNNLPSSEPLHTPPLPRRYSCSLRSSVPGFRRPFLSTAPPGRLPARRTDRERAVLEPPNELRRSVELDSVASLWKIWARFCTLYTTVPELDPLADRVLGSFACIGPVFETVAASGFALPWPADDPRPLVLVSFSSGRAWDQRSRIERTLAALSGAPYRALVTTGPVEASLIAFDDCAAHRRLERDRRYRLRHRNHHDVQHAVLTGEHRRIEQRVRGSRCDSGTRDRDAGRANRSTQRDSKR
jgi:hypothetical protein